MRVCTPRKYKCQVGYSILLRTGNDILQFLCVDRAHIPLTTNIVADTRQRKQLGSSNVAILLGVKTIIPLGLAGYEIVKANSALRTSHLPSHIQRALVE